MLCEKKKRNHYDVEFKKRAVRILFDSGKPVTEIAHNLGIEQSNLHKWSKRYGIEVRDISLSTGTEGSYRTEISELKKEISSIKNTVEVLRGIILKTLGNKYTCDYMDN